jgi:hypothetical protein
MSDFGYHPQAPYPPGQIGDGNGLSVGDWRFPLVGADPSNPLQPVPPPQTGGPLDKSLDKYNDRSAQPWINPPVWGLLDNSGVFGDRSGSGNISLPGDPSNTLAAPTAEPQKFQGSAIPYAREYDQYQRQSDGSKPQAPIFDLSDPPPLFAPPNYPAAFGNSSVERWIASLTGVDPQDPTQPALPPFNPYSIR